MVVVFLWSCFLSLGNIFMQENPIEFGRGHCYLKTDLNFQINHFVVCFNCVWNKRDRLWAIRFKTYATLEVPNFTWDKFQTSVTRQLGLTSMPLSSPLSLPLCGCSLPKFSCSSFSLSSFNHAPMFPIIYSAFLKPSSINVRLYKQIVDICNTNMEESLYIFLKAQKLESVVYHRHTFLNIALSGNFLLLGTVVIGPRSPSWICV